MTEQKPIDCLEVVYVNASKLAKAAICWAKEHGKTTEEVIALVLIDILDNLLVDAELEENIIVNLAQTFDVPVINVQHEINNLEI